MNWEQLKAILWLRWRLSLNQWRKAGTFSFVLMMILVVTALVFAALSFFLSLGLGISLLGGASPTTLLIVWDVIVGILLFSWAVSLMVEIQRSELLSLERLLHLPMTLRDAFLLNYLSSLISLNTVCFIPTAIGLSLALAFTHGPLMLWLIPMVFSFVLMLTAVTYQVRGWLASLMSDKRRQRSVITLITLSFVIVAQLPNVVIQLTLPAASRANQERVAEESRLAAELSQKLQRQEVTLEVYNQQLTELTASFAQRKKDMDAARQAKLDNYLSIGNAILPVGWLPLSTAQLASGSVWHAGWCFLGMTTIGMASLWRSYASTIAYYTGKASYSGSIPAAIIPVIPKAKVSNVGAGQLLFMERNISGLSEHASAVALCNFKCLLRAPEVKMMLVGPVILGIILSLALINNKPPKIPAGADVLVWMTGIGLLTFMCIMLILNIFGMDRGGFRCYLLMPIERREILIGKNFSILPMVSLIALLFAAAAYYLAPLGLMDFLACGCQLLIIFLLASLVGNLMSIYFPIAMIPGSGKPVQLNLPMFLAMTAVICLSPMLLVPGFIFCGIQWLLSYYFAINYLPVFAVLSMLELWGASQFYKIAIDGQARIMQARETKMLEALTLNVE